MDNMWIFWLILTFIFVLTEIFTVALVSVWFAAGSVVALIAALAGASLEVQILLMVFVSICFFVLFILLRKRLGLFPGQKVRTNADRLIGEVGEVIQEIDSLEARGQVSVNGQIWSAKPESVSNIPIGCKVRILGLSGVKLVVEPIQ